MINFKIKNTTSLGFISLCASRIPASQTRWPNREERKQEEESTQKVKEMKREGEKSREALLVITVISMSFSERLDWSRLKSSSLTGNPQEDLSVKRNRRASGNKREEIGEGRMKVREKLDNSYVYTQNERILITELGSSCSESRRCQHQRIKCRSKNRSKEVVFWKKVDCINLSERLIKYFWRRKKIFLGIRLEVLAERRNRWTYED